MGTTKTNKQYMAARVRERREAVYNEDGIKQVGTVVSRSPYNDSRHTRRHPYKARITLHTKVWTKSRINYYAKLFSSAVKMKSSAPQKEKKSFLRSLVNLFA